MPINTVNTTKEEKDFKFVQNRTSILHTNSTNKVTFNHVNAIVHSPNVGDVMCVTRYTDENDSLLPADKQKVIWIDGLSINPKQLSQKYDPVGICVAVNGNKAMVRYRKEESYKWSEGERWELPLTKLLEILGDSQPHDFKIILDGAENPNTFSYRKNSSGTIDSTVADFVSQLNGWFLKYKSACSAELVESDTDLPITGTPNSYRIIVNARFNLSGWLSFVMTEISTGKKLLTKRAIGKHITAINRYYINNCYTKNTGGGCCRYKYYDYYSLNGENPSSTMTSINTSTYPVSLSSFTSNVNCQILRDNFAAYDEYIDSMMVKHPCGKGGVITEFPSGKDNTYKLANCTFLNNIASKQQTLYPAANWAASIDINAPGLQTGNWWLPSVAEMLQMMRDITYGTTLWDAKPDIVNRVLLKLNSFDSENWSMLSATMDRWTSSRYDQGSAYYCNGYTGNLHNTFFFYDRTVAPITLYEF